MGQTDMIRLLFTLLCFSLLSVNAQATTVDINNGDCDLGVNCWTATVGGAGNPDFDIPDTGTSSILEAFAPILGSLAEVYKTDSGSGSGTPVSESGILSGSYTTMYEFVTSPPGEEYRGATISYDGGDSLDCSVECYLLVKDGNQSPGAYLFNLALAPSWNGTMDLILKNFWVGNGSISHVALYGNVGVIPVPAAFWLFGTALIGFIGFSRRTSV